MSTEDPALPNWLDVLHQSQFSSSNESLYPAQFLCLLEKSVLGLRTVLLLLKNQVISQKSVTSLLLIFFVYHHLLQNHIYLSVHRHTWSLFEHFFSAVFFSSNDCTSITCTYMYCHIFQAGSWLQFFSSCMWSLWKSFCVI